MLIVEAPHRACSASIFVCLLLWTMPVSAQDFTLTKDGEVGFQRLLHSAQTGQLGDDITNANVSVLKDKVRVELILADGTTRLLLLTHKDSPQTFSRLFNVELGEGATASDATRVGKVLDEAFGGDPFVVSLDFLGVSASNHPTSGLAEAWEYGNWKSVLAVLERRLVAPRGVTDTVGVIVTLGIAVLASLILLWGSEPPGVASR